MILLEDAFIRVAPEVAVGLLIFSILARLLKKVHPVFGPLSGVSFLICAGLLILTYVLCGGQKLGSGGEYVEFQANVKLKVNPEELQKWATPIIEGRESKYPIQPQDITIHRADIPNFLKSMASGEPEAAFLRNVGRPDGSMMILWGGGFYHFGLLVGKSGYKPSGVSAMAITFWKDGIYFVEQDQ